MGLKRSILIFLLCMAFAPRLHAQAGQTPAFSPPRPVVGDPAADFDDPDEDGEFGDVPNRPPALPSQPNTPPPPVPDQGIPMDFNPSGPGAGRDANKLHFKVVDGVFWEKGKPRGRAPLNDGKKPAGNSGFIND